LGTHNAIQFNKVKRPKAFARVVPLLKFYLTHPNIVRLTTTVLMLNNKMQA